MKASGLGFLCLVVVLCLACGGQADTPAADAAPEVPEEQPQEQAQAPAAEPSKPETPEELGNAIGTVYVDAMKKVIELGKDHPPVEEIKPQVIELRDECIAKLVELGRIKEGLTDEEKAKVNSTLRTKSREVKDMFTDYGNAINFYLNEDKETYDMLAGFNVITQYADFDLLKKQEPEEAARLGIE